MGNKIIDIFMYSSARVGSLPVFLLLLFFFTFFFLSICLFIYLWLCWVFVSVRGLSPVVAGATPHHGARASHCRGLSCCGAQAPDAQAQ